MAIKYDNVIVFGPTGAVGRAVSQEAAKRGAKVTLAMRDPSKKIPGLDEQQGKFERIKADLGDVASVESAIRQSGAKAAFFYQIHGTGDGMRSVIETMKTAGVEYVVFLSSFTIFPEEDPHDVSRERLIPYLHASIEATIDDLGLASTMLRPGAFAYNIFHQDVDRSSDVWKAEIPESDRKADCIVPKDIGRVGGAVLVDRPAEGQKEIVYLYGPALLTREDMIATIGKVSGKQISTTVQSTDDHIKSMVARGLPEIAAKYLCKADNGQLHDRYYADGRHEEGWENIKKYSGYEPTSFETFVDEYLAEN
ncbi:NAD(P)-binding protein [Pseudovirgaria hyperparasitica]|uniref:NAD(P)-binding protein n=1 Tax=Pseudovirgaria hyperparasitica TaxID=470096 RepID=A0A6A6WKB4_9PEZI|nr:NAD(P)-binding protein [Pseudovirgaria hyperparasitica]KAF2762596.1 NAD(P)-binding protein [Pseudovirgaria hyperparasitica]